MTEEAAVYLLQFDTVMGRFEHEVTASGSTLSAGAQNAKTLLPILPNPLIATLMGHQVLSVMRALLTRAPPAPVHTG